MPQPRPKKELFGGVGENCRQNLVGLLRPLCRSRSGSHSKLFFCVDPPTDGGGLRGHSEVPLLAPLQRPAIEDSIIFGPA